MYERDIVQSLCYCMHTHLFVPCFITTITGQVGRGLARDGVLLTWLIIRETYLYVYMCMYEIGHYPTRYILDFRGGGWLTYFRWEVATNMKLSAQPSTIASHN